jgi:hypothetical protein
MDIEHYISDLLYEHDCVIIPGLGGFIGNQTPARINPVHHTFSPPGKTLLFNINLKQNDGLLANRIALGKKIPYEEAMELIRSFVSHSNSLLRDGKKIKLDDIGTIYNDSRGTLQFDQDKNVNYLPESYGLTSFISLPVQRHGKHIGIERKITRMPGPSKGRKRNIGKTLKWAALLALPVGAAILIGITNFSRIKDIPVSYSGLLYSSSSTVSPPAPSPDKVKISIQAPTHPLITIAPVSPAPELRPVPTVSRESSGIFGIIVGAFRIRENAERLVDDLRGSGHDALIFDQTRTGLSRVSIRNYSNRDEALTALAMVRAKEFPAAWLLEK